ncbi:MAG: DUF4340 domain-containing protein [Proteobacteria bacterium]|nr:DUF4340 domain-containing protein [Pseudomonadota bacterium]
MKNWKTAAGLGVILLGLSGLATWDEWQSKKDDKDKETSNLLTSIKPDQVKAFVFHTSGDADAGGDKTPAVSKESLKAVDVEAKLAEGKWQITSPVNEPADQQVVQDLIKNVTDYKFEKEITSGKDQWQQFGLNTPRRLLTLETTDGAKTSVLVGINAPVGFSTYVATDKSEKVFAGSQYIATSLAKSLFDFRDKKLLSILQTDIDTISYKSGSEKAIEFSRTDGKWQISAPESTQADTVIANNFLDDVLALKATEFIDTPSKSQQDMFAVSKTFAVIKLSGAKIGSREIKISKDKGGSLFATLDPAKLVIKIGDDSKTKFSKSVDDFRNKKIFEFQSTQVDEVDLDGKFFTRVKDDWQTKEAAAKFDKDGKFSGSLADAPKPLSHIRTLLVDLEYGKADAVLGLNSDVVKKLPAVPKNQIKLNFAPAASRPPLVIDIWQAGDSPDAIYLRTSESPKVFKAKKSLIASMNAAPVLPAEEASFQAPAAAIPPAPGAVE